MDSPIPCVELVIAHGCCCFFLLSGNQLRETNLHHIPLEAPVTIETWVIASF